MTAKEKAIELLESKKEISPKKLAKKAGVTRQHASSVLNELRDEGKAIRLGSGPQIVYVTPDHRKLSEVRFSRELKNHNLKEHEVLNQAQKDLPFLTRLSDNVRSIFEYAFSEMLNNAIEHSQSEKIQVEIGKEQNYLLFIVKDQGVGVFKDIMKKKKLDSELEAIQDLLKGKTTTQPEAHSGEGIFFTSKVTDIFMLESFGFRLRVDNTIDDVFVEELDPKVKGTRVVSRINLESDKHLGDIFKKYQSDSVKLGFDKTEVRIKLYTMGTVYVSRSQARRVLAGLEKFETIILDFDKVPTIGQGFADEIFRVFQKKHPRKEIVPANTNEAVQFMIDRVEKNEI